MLLKNQNPDGTMKLKNAPPKVEEKKEETPKKRRVKKNG